MLTYNVKENEFGKQIKIQTNEGIFWMIFGGNLDLYWIPINNSETDKITYTITKENYYLFELFNNTYEKLINYKIFDNDELNKTEKLRDKSLSHPLIESNTINWYSDEDKVEEASLLTISKELDNSIKISFEKSKLKDSINTHAIRFRNHGTRYSYANLVFMDMYLKLCNSASDKYHQIHIEEYLFNKNKVLKR